jgi:hypothetical protein
VAVDTDLDLTIDLVIRGLFFPFPRAFCHFYTLFRAL